MTYVTMLPRQAQDTFGIVIQATAQYAPVGDVSEGGDLRRAAPAPLVEPKAASAEQVKIYPNPAREQLIISMPEDMALYSVQVTSSLGKAVFRQRFDNQPRDIKIRVNDWPQGIYIVTLIGKNGELLGQKKVSVVK
jgi:hypothetical protein